MTSGVLLLIFLVKAHEPFSEQSVRNKLIECKDYVT